LIGKDFYACDLIYKKVKIMKSITNFQDFISESISKSGVDGIHRLYNKFIGEVKEDIQDLFVDLVDHDFKVIVYDPKYYDAAKIKDVTLIKALSTIRGLSRTQIQPKFLHLILGITPVFNIKIYFQAVEEEEEEYEEEEYDVTDVSLNTEEWIRRNLLLYNELKKIQRRFEIYKIHTSNAEYLELSIKYPVSNTTSEFKELVKGLCEIELKLCYEASPIFPDSNSDNLFIEVKRYTEEEKRTGLSNGKDIYKSVAFLKSLIK
jgi:hypothetical protein